jgi:sulfonate transport system ATP-binding protein
MVGGIVFNNISKSFSREGVVTQALSDVSLEIKPGEFVTLIGASGCGKSTLLRICAGLATPDSGEVLMDGKPVLSPSPERGFAFQEHTLFPWLNIRQNLSFGLNAGKTRPARHSERCRNDEIVNEWLEIIGLSGFDKHYPHELSGGMCQRASLARAMLVSPKVLLLDEPLGALDAFTRMNIQDEILRIHEDKKTTMIMVTHDVDEAVYMSDRVVILSPRPGKIERIFDIQLARPRARSSEDFAYYRAQILNLLHFGGDAPTAEYYL